MQAPLGASLDDHGAINRRVYYGLGRGVQLGDVKPDSVAARAGLVNGDWVFDVDGVDLKSQAQAKSLFEAIPNGSSVTATIRHRGQISTVKLQF
jgi:S1-C subfamily serine protease